MENIETSYSIDTEDQSIFEGNKASVYLQNAVIAGLIHNSYMFALVQSQEVNESYFRDSSCSIIFKGLAEYFKEYQDLPKNLNDICLAVEKAYIGGKGVKLDQVISRVKDLYRAGLDLRGNDRYIAKCTEDLIIKVKTNKAASKVLDKLKNINEGSGTLNIQEFVQEMIDSMNVNLEPIAVYNMSDMSRLEEIRKEAYGEEGESRSRVVKSCIARINESFQYGGYQVGTLNLIVSPPGCFTGDTKIMTLDGSYHSLQELYENKMKIGIYGCNKEGKLSVDLAESVYLSDYVDRLIEIEIDRNYRIKCTEDHPFMLRDGNYRRADQLREGDLLMPITREKVRHKKVKRDSKEKVSVERIEMIFNRDKEYAYTSLLSSNLKDIDLVEYRDRNPQNNYPDNLLERDSSEFTLIKDNYKIKNIKKYYFNEPRVTKITRLRLEERVPVYGIINAGRNHNYAIKLNQKRGVFVSNTGKTSFLINEGAYAAQQGKEVLHVYLGDMITQDSNIRYLSCISGLLQNDIAGMSIEDYKRLIESINNQYPGVLSRINCMCFATGDISVNKLLEVIKKDQVKNNKHYDFINIDYADNFEKTMDNTYQEAGYIYERLAWFGRTNHSVMMVASQPKLTYWSEEIIPMEGAAESSKKQHISDSILTMNRAAKGLTFGTIFVAKMRRGTTGNILRYQSHWERCKIVGIEEETYKQLRHDAGMS